MNSIYYFNINYSCNNKCIFCFSHNTGNECRNIDFNLFAKNIQSASPDESDKIIINGGEPSLHPDFYKTLNYIENHFCSNTVVYTNGTLLKTNELKKLKRTFFVIPIHGCKNLHNEITRNIFSFDQTIYGVQELQNENLPYAIKFILNKDMVESDFQIYDFLQTNNLHPNKIFLARLNKTIKAVQNNVQYPSFFDLQKYLHKCHNSLKKIYELIYLDIPLCFIMDEDNHIQLPTTPSFFYADYRKNLTKKSYYKEIKILGEKCRTCQHNPICSIMQNSYLTLDFQKEWKLILE